MKKIQRTTGVEPASQAWEAWIMPLYDVRMIFREFTLARNTMRVNSFAAILSTTCGFVFFADHVALYLAAYGFGKLRNKIHDAGIFVGGGNALDVVLQLPP